MNHGKVVCKQCGTILEQCRCMEGHKNVISVLCEECKKKPCPGLAEYARGE